MTKTPKKPAKPAEPQKPTHKEGQGVPSAEGPATSIPPNKGGNPKFTRIECTQDELWQIYMSFSDRDLSSTAIHEVLTAKGIRCSVQWVKERIAYWDFPRKRAHALAGTAHPSDFDEMKIRNFLDKLGKTFHPMETLPGMQTRLLTVLSSKLVTESPEYLQGLMKLYAMITDELMRNYQKRLEGGEIIPLPQAKTDDPAKVTPFRKREGIKS